MVEKKLEAAVGMSRKWDAREAGKEVARSAIEKLSKPPEFLVLFSTIHYRDHGGFQELLNGVYDVLPEGTPLVGGTVRGFSNTYGCYARGATSLAVSSNNMDVTVGVGNNTKRNPKKAAIKCAKMVRNGLKNSTYENSFLLNIISGSEVPNMPPLGRKKIIEPGATPKALMKLFSFSQYTLQMGAARDEEVTEEMISQLPEFSMLGGATLDNGPNFRSYQFCRKEVLKNAIVSLGIKTNNNFFVQTTNNMIKTNISFKITKTSKDGRIIHEINGKPALSELLRLLNWPKEILNEDTWLKTTFYFPIGGKYNEEDEDDVPHMIGIILGESLLLTYKSKNSNASILTIDGKRLLDAIDLNLSSMKIQPEFGLMSSCTTRLETMGNRISQARDRISKYMKDSPFIVFYVGGESTYSPKKGLKYANMSFNSAIFLNDKQYN
ncbi:FIST domain-containing protein [Thermoplasmatales archaeon SCGC AB-539-C06]|nr:FIST domain-containing protein [Thermoplasmatales archaeon SCGC AB-539-C06]